MSPEQARGQEVDPRTDIWAFGCVLYECLTGKRAFGGETSVDVLTSVVDRDPDWEVLPAETPPGIRGLLGRCLRKNPRERLRHIVDARIWLEESSVSLPATGVALGEAAKSRQRRVRTVWIAVCGLTAVVGGLALWLLLSPRPAVSPTYWEVGVAPAESISDDLGDRPSRTAVALSPDGKSLVFVGRRGGTRQLYLGAPGRPEASPIAGTEQADSPFFSPDGRWIGFWAGPVGPGTRGELKKIALEGGLPVTLCGTGLLYGASWGSDDSIVFATRFENPGSPMQPGTFLQRVPASGGAPQTVTTPDRTKGEVLHSLPQVLPGARAILFTITRGFRRSEDAQVVARSLATGEQKVLAEGATDARYVRSGHLVYVRMGKLMARRFDLARLEVTGGETAMVDDVMQSLNRGGRYRETGAAQFSVSDSGALVYVRGGISPDAKFSLVWVDRSGAAEPLLPEPHPYTAPRLSPDGRQVAFTYPGGPVWTYDMVRGGAPTRLAAEGENYFSIWSPDGRRVTFGSRLPGGTTNLFWRLADGSAPAERLTADEHIDWPSSWSPDGTLAFVRFENGSDVWLLSVEGGTPKSRPLLRTIYDESYPEFSPDGRWLAYVSGESGSPEVYVRPYPGPGGRHKISTDGGNSPAWTRNGRELVYAVLRDDRTVDMMAVDVATSPAFVAGKPRRLFTGPYAIHLGVRGYDVMPDGSRFLMVDTRADQPPAPATHIILVQNWLEELKRRVPAR